MVVQKSYKILSDSSTLYGNKMYHPEDLAIYIHWPFCNSKCPYCDFYKEINKNINQEIVISEYLQALQRYNELLPDRKIKSIFFGGGTPSLIKPNHISDIIDFIASKWSTLENIEISLEANPNSHYKTMFHDLRTAGINRLSLGIQSLNDSELRFLGRTHTANQARQCLQEVLKIFDNHSADLIYALPQQTPESWKYQLEEISSYGLKHISLYQLTIEEGTVFAKRNINVMNEDDLVNIYNLTRSFLKNSGYNHYEISNFAKNNFQSQHNLTYWQGGDYIGIGKSAHGRICLNGRHFAVTYPFLNEELSPIQRAEELIIMGLRLSQGINKQHFKNISGLDFNDFVNKDNLIHLKKQRILIENSKYVYPGYDGLLLADAIARQLCE